MGEFYLGDERRRFCASLAWSGSTRPSSFTSCVWTSPSLCIAHVVPLVTSSYSILESLPRFLQAAYPSQPPAPHLSVARTPGFLRRVYSKLFVLIADLRSSRSPFKLTFLFQIHNLILTSGSLVLLLLMLEEM